MGSYTEVRKLAKLCELNHVQIAPQHDCFIHAHLVAASPAGCIVEAFTDPDAIRYQQNFSRMRRRSSKAKLNSHKSQD